MTYDCFTSAQLESICKSLAETHEGLTGSEIGHFLRQINVVDTDPSLTKWKRLYNALAHHQNEHQSGNCVLSFIHTALNPVRYRDRNALFESGRNEVNVALAFYGMEYGKDGKFYRRSKVATLSEAEERANRLRAALSQRNIEEDVLRFCKAELLQNNCFHAVLEATKSIAEKLRARTGVTSDGSILIDVTLGGNEPLLRINELTTESHRSEQKGFVNLVKGLFGTFRNPTAHAPKIEWPISERDALDLFSIASYVHRRINDAVSLLSGLERQAELRQISRRHGMATAGAAQFRKK
jgi:uncharacterized protein (TIGR02391 family)